MADKKPTYDELAAQLADATAQLAAANDKLAKYEAANAQRIADETAIAKKTSLGLTREQAIAVIQRQKEYDAAEAAAKKAKEAPAK